MLNFTIVSLSLSSLYLPSPMFIGNQYLFQQSFFTNIISPILFFNQEQLKLSKNSFIRGMGSLVYYNDAIYGSFKNIYLNNNNKTKISTNNDKHLFVISECLFDQIQDDQDDAKFIDVGSSVTFYMTSCTFNKCNFATTAISIQSRANTLSHICCYGLFHNKGNNLEALFLLASPPEKSFLTFYYSSIVGDYEMTDENKKPHNILKIDSKISVKYQCMNLSNFNIKKDSSSDSPQYSIFRLTAPTCLNMMMSTFRDLSSGAILHINPQDGDYSFRHYIGMCNFENNNCDNSLIFVDMNDNTQINIDNCIFKNPNHKTKIFNSNQNSKAHINIENCVFDTTVDFGRLSNYTYTNCIFNDKNHNMHSLAHYIVEGVCFGVPHDNAYGCKNESCPENMGCGPNAFDFGEEDVSYSEILHTDVDTPTPSPTVAFTKSLEFSYSLSFSDSNHFTNSYEFSSSKPFSETKEFTKTDYFSQTEIFSKSNSFSKSFIFSKSDFFSKSSYFTYSSYFSESDKFTKTDQFTKTGSFSKSNSFSKSFMFTESNKFSKSSYFTCSSPFSKTDKFSKTTEFTLTGKFSESNHFSKSFDFTISNSFEPTEDFNHTHHFTPSSTFSKSNRFSKSNFFTTSDEFSKSSYFTKTSQFTQTDYFSQTSKFSNSFLFTQSENFKPTNHFLSTKYFSNSDSFTSSNDFSGSFYFTKSKKFTNSIEFTYSETFSPSKTFKRNNQIIINIKSDESNKVSIGTKIGIGLAAGCIVLAGVIVGIIFIRKRKIAYEHFDDEGIEIRPLTDSSFVTQNPLTSLMSDDDPFEDEFA